MTNHDFTHAQQGCHVTYCSLFFMLFYSRYLRSKVLCPNRGFDFSGYMGYSLPLLINVNIVTSVFCKIKTPIFHVYNLSLTGIKTLSPTDLSNAFKNASSFIRMLWKADYWMNDYWRINVRSFTDSIPSVVTESNWDDSKLSLRTVKFCVFQTKSNYFSW